MDDEENDDDDDDDVVVGVAVNDTRTSVEAICKPEEYGTGPNLDRIAEMLSFVSSFRNFRKDGTCCLLRREKRCSIDDNDDDS
jgi:hypothetical protein